MQNNKDTIDIFNVLFCIGLALFGTVARTASEITTFTWKKALANAVVASFTGCLCGVVMHGIDLHIAISYTIAGLSGWLGVRFINAFVYILKNKLGVKDEGL